MINSEGIRFIDESHMDFYAEKVNVLKSNIFGKVSAPDVYLKSLIYTLGMCSDTRRRFDSIYDEKKRSINTGVISEAWQTGSSLKVTRLAFQLFTDSTPTAYVYDENDKVKENISECEKYSVSDVFCCSYAPYFVEAIRLRYPEYLTRNEVGGNV